MDAVNKRPLDVEDDERPDTKRPKVVVPPEPESACPPEPELACPPGPSASPKEELGIENLYDDVIMHIFRYLSNDNLAKMALVCPTLSRVSKDWTFWKNVRFEKYDKSMESIYFNYFQKCTTHLTIIGTEVPTYDASVTHKFLIQLELGIPKLTHFALCNQILDANEISIRLLHQKLKSFTIERTIIENIPENSAYLCGLNITCPDLEDVRILFNDWFVPICLYALAKLEKLTYLSLQGCSQFMNCIPYASITTLTGFKSLQTLDLRLTPINDNELLCFQKLKNLKHVLLESPENNDHEDGATITDMGLSGFCHNSYEFQYPYIQIFIDRDGDVNMRRIGDRDDHSDKCNLENLYVRNYPKVTDTFLKNAAKTCKSLNFLDVTGTKCTSDEIERYKAKRPDITIVY